ncbi:MAG: hypothetical protein Q7K55_05215, partial [Candidatus Levybacteria bacterium]|nr:hypothetical protein [Candidatus Levybacteria bacterium]
LFSRVIQEINEIPDVIPEPELTLPAIGNDIVTDISPMQPIASQLEPEVSSIQQTEEIINDSIAQPDPISDLDLQVNSFIQEISDNKLSSNVIATEPDVNADVSTMPIVITQQEVVANAKQAVKVEAALMAIGNTKEEAHQTALKVFTETKQKKDLTMSLQQEQDQKVPKMQRTNAPTQIKENFFAHDNAADAEREKITTVAVEHAVEIAISNGKQEISGYDLAREMPADPQPTPIKSEIVKDGNDGSYEQFIEEIRSIGTIESDDHAKQIIQRAVSNNHAVLKTNQRTSTQASEQEVRKVLRSGVIFENKK